VSPNVVRRQAGYVLVVALGNYRNALLSPRQRQTNRCTFSRDRFGPVHHALAYPVSEATRSPADTGNKSGNEHDQGEERDLEIIPGGRM